MCAEASNVDHLIKAKEQSPHLKNLILFDNIPEEKMKKAVDAGLQVYHFNDVIAKGKELKEV